MTSLWSRLRKLFVSDANKKSKRTKRPRMRCFSGGRFEQLESRELLTVTYHGGALLSHVEAQNVYLGSDWATNSSLTSQSASLDSFTGYLVNSPYMDMLSNAGYNVGRGSSSAGATLSLSLNKSTTGGITDQQIQSDIQSGITAKQLQAPDANRLYVVYVEPGVVVKLGSDSSRTSFLGYHGAFAGRTATGASADIRYDVMPYPGTPNPSPGSQGYASAFDELTSVTSHEVAEAVTDPDVNYKTLGWYDDRLNGEIGDLASSETRLNGYLVQNVVGKNDQVISPVDNGGGSGGGGGGGGGTITISPPTNVAASAISSTSARITWTGSSGATGYRVLEVIGTTATVIGTLGPAATSATVTNLTAGSTVTFKIEAFSGTTVADSASVSLTLPTPPPTTTLTAPQVTGAAASSTSISLSWNAITGAQGYRIYWWNGFRAVLIGTVSASTTSVTVVGVLPGSTAQLLVQAFAGTTVANSNWISVSTPRRTTRI